MKRSKPDLIVAAVLLASALARFWLACSGGTRFFPDEGRYTLALKAISALAGLRFGDAVDYLLLQPIHQLAPVAMLPAAALQSAVVMLGGVPLSRSEWVPALLFSVASVAVLALVYRLARKAGADAAEARLGLLLAACSNVLFYWARHLTTYDASLALGLWALLPAMDRDTSWKRSTAAGALAAASFLVYNGYFPLAAIVGAVHLAAGPRARAAVVRRAAGLALGAVIPALPVAAAAVLRRPGALARTLDSAGTIVQGEFAEGWRFPFEYLWQAETGMVLVWLLGMALAAAALCRRGPERARGALWLGCALAVYAALALTSSGLNLFVVYGRNVRPLVPFAALAAAFGFRRVAGALPRPAVAAAAGLLILGAAVNFREPLVQTFPLEFLDRARAAYGNIREASTFDGAAHFRNGPRQPFDPAPLARALRLAPSFLRPLLERNLEVLAADLRRFRAIEDGPARYVVVDAEIPYMEAPVPRAPLPAGRVVADAPHPFAYAPYRYEGFKPAVRRYFAGADMRMRVVEAAGGE